jgi:hypothetical protein
MYHDRFDSPDEMKPKMVYFDKTVCLLVSFVARHPGIGSGTVWVERGMARATRSLSPVHRSAGLIFEHRNLEQYNLTACLTCCY